MSYGASAYGSASYGGNANSVNEQVFFPILPDNYAPDVLYERSALFNGPESFYEILIRQGSENPSGPNGAEYEVFTADHEGATPQSQVKIGGSGQTIIASAPIIIVTAFIDSAILVTGLNFSIVGRPYTQ